MECDLLKKVSGIYLITFKRTCQKYVGYSGDIYRRFKDHYNSPERTSRIDRAILKYGIENFSLTILEETEDDEHIMGEREKYWIKKLNTYENDFHYNLTPGGENPPIMKGKEHPQYRDDVPDGETLFKEWLDGESFRELAIKYDCSFEPIRYRVLDYANQNNMDFKELSNKKYSGENNKNFGTSIIEDFGGMDYIKQSIKKNKSLTDLADEMGLSSHKAIAGYLETRGTSYTEIRNELGSSSGSQPSKIDKMGGIDYIKDQIKNNKSANEIAEELGFTNSNAIYNYLTRRGTSYVELQNKLNVEKPNRFSEIEELGGLDYIKEELKNFKSIVDIANGLNLKPNKLYDYLNYKNTNYTKLKKELGFNGSHRSIIDKMGGVEFLKEQYKQNKTTNEIAKELGLKNGNAISFYLRRKNISVTQIQEDIIKENPENNTFKHNPNLNYPSKNNKNEVDKSNPMYGVRQEKHPRFRNDLPTPLELLSFKEQSGKTNKELAEYFDCNISTIKRRLKRARSELGE